MKRRDRRPSAPIGGCLRFLCALCALCGWLSFSLRTAAASDLDEFRIKRELPLERSADFAEPPRVTRNGDRVTIRFAAKGLCDVTVAIENAEGRILRHLASGVLGPNAPEPFQKGSKVQTLVWDGKDDQGRYIDDKDSLTVRVSLGLEPRLERTLFWNPKKRVGHEAPLLAAAPEGVYVFEGKGVDHLRLFDHEGRYVRTVYPFPAGRLEAVLGLDRRVFPQDGLTLPVKHGFQQASLLSSGTTGLDDVEKHTGGVGATGLAVHNGRIALAYHHLNRLSTDGSTGGLPLGGPATGYRFRWNRHDYTEGLFTTIGPSSLAFSPDGRWLYMTGYLWHQAYPLYAGCLQGVARVAYDAPPEAPLETFVGEMTETGWGTDNRHFRVPSALTVDTSGRVYVCDFLNDRVQVYGPDGAYLKTIATPKPAQVRVHRRTGEIYVFSWPIIGIPHDLLRRGDYNPRDHQPTVTRFASFENPRRVVTQDLAVSSLVKTGMFAVGQSLSVEVDDWAERPSLWIVGRRSAPTRVEVSYWGVNTLERANVDPWSTGGVHILAEENGRWVVKHNFAEEVRQRLLRVKPPDFSRQRLYVNPATGLLYVGEDLGFGKSFKELVEIDPETGRLGLVELPFDSEDLAFDLNGLAYLRTDTLVVRYDPGTWREVMWDYGERRRAVGFSTLGGGKRTEVVAGLPTPGQRPVCWNQGGMAVSPTGFLAVACCSRATVDDRRESWKDRFTDVAGKPYAPDIYPGRVRWGEVHIWDRFGKLVHADAFPGLTILHGLGLDEKGDLYVMAAPNRILDGQPYWNEMAGTLIKITPGKGRVVSSSSRATIPVGESDRPAGPLEVGNSKTGPSWVPGAQWFYGGVGYCGFNTARVGGGCDCWNSHFAFDDFARSFAPEVDHYGVAVVDRSGNLITRVGRYGNVDDGVALMSAGGPPNARSIGGDEVSLFHAAYLGVHTDHRLFIADAGNGRILSVRLGYHATARVPLSEVPDADRPGFTTKDAKNAKTEQD